MLTLWSLASYHQEPEERHSKKTSTSTVHASKRFQHPQVTGRVPLMPPLSPHASYKHSKMRKKCPNSNSRLISIISPWPGQHKSGKDSEVAKENMVPYVPSCWKERPFLKWVYSEGLFWSLRYFSFRSQAWKEQENQPGFLGIQWFHSPVFCQTRSTLVTTTVKTNGKSGKQFPSPSLLWGQVFNSLNSPKL